MPARLYVKNTPNSIDTKEKINYTIHIKKQLEEKMNKIVVLLGVCLALVRSYINI